MRLIPHNELARNVVQNALQIVISPPFAGTLVMDGERIAGAVIVNDYTGDNAELTGVGFGCWSPAVVRGLARYLFGQLGCRRVTARTAEDNEKAIKALERIGFEREGIAREWFNGKDAILFGLLKSKQRLVR